MAPNDAEMAARHGTTEDRQRIADDMAALRADLKGLTEDVKRLGSHQVEDMQAVAAAALTSIAIALGAGFIYGVLTRR
jgi:hypothetical protein